MGEVTEEGLEGKKISSSTTWRLDETRGDKAAGSQSWKHQVFLGRY